MQREGDTPSTTTFEVQAEARGSWEVRDGEHRVVLSGFTSATDAERAARRLAGGCARGRVLVRDRYGRLHQRPQ